MPFPPFFRRLFGDNPVKPYKIRKELLPLDVDAVETFRKSLIGCLIPTTMATLPSCLGIPDGSLFLFEDYPELQEKYASGGFNGMLLESTASSEEKDAWRGKWIKHPQGHGLYSPRLSGLFLRNGGTVGKFNVAGLPNIAGGLGNTHTSTLTPGDTGALYWASTYKAINSILTTESLYPSLLSIDASRSSDKYGKSDTVMPESTNILYGLYLGKSS